MNTKISAQEWQVRQELAASYRLFIKFGWTDLIFTHLSARVPGHPEHYLINPYGLLFHEITASNLIKVDFEGNVISGDYPYNGAGHAIHSSILKSRPDINVVMHSHTRAGIAVSCMQEGLLPLSQQAGEIMDMVCYHPYGVATNDAEECASLSRDMADKWLMIMQNHGLLSAGRTVAEAFYHLYVLEIACKVQVDVMASGAKQIHPSPEARAAITKYGAMPTEGPAGFVTTSWDALIRQLDKEDDSYRN